MMKRFALPVALLLCPALAPAWQGAVKTAKREFVCMMQDMVLTKPGIPIQHEGKTYYGCCEMCKEKIRTQPQKYTRSKDPVSGRQVDKATAFIGDLYGDAYYFSTDANLKAFAKNPDKYLKK